MLHWLHPCRKKVDTTPQEDSGYTMQLHPCRKDMLHQLHPCRKKVDSYTPRRHRIYVPCSCTLVGRHMLHWLHPCRRKVDSYTPRRHRRYHAATPLQEDTCFIGHTPVGRKWTTTPLEDTGYTMQLHPCRKTYATLATLLQEERRQLHPQKTQDISAAPLQEDTCYIGYTPAGRQWTTTPREDTGYTMQLHPCRKRHATLATLLPEDAVYQKIPIRAGRFLSLIIFHLQSL